MERKDLRLPPALPADWEPSLWQISSHLSPDRPPVNEDNWAHSRIGKACAALSRDKAPRKR